MLYTRQKVSSLWMAKQSFHDGEPCILCMYSMLVSEYLTVKIGIWLILSKDV